MLTAVTLSVLDLPFRSRCVRN